MLESFHAYNETWKRSATTAKQARDNVKVRNFHQAKVNKSQIAKDRTLFEQLESSEIHKSQARLVYDSAFALQTTANATNYWKCSLRQREPTNFEKSLIEQNQKALEISLTKSAENHFCDKSTAGKTQRQHFSKQEIEEYNNSWTHREKRFEYLHKGRY